MYNTTCSVHSYDIMLQCWELNPDKRPTASELVAFFNPDAEALSDSDISGSSFAVDADISVSGYTHTMCKGTQIMYTCGLVRVIRF